MIREFVSTLRTHLSTPYPLLQVILGPRQVGKTFGVKQLMESWEGKAIYKTADMLSPPSTNWIVENWKLAEFSGDGTLLVLDEIQKIPGWSEAIKLLFDEIRNKIDLKVVILGSASLSLQEGLTESLTGRYELIRAYHWQLSESRTLEAISLDEYLLYGGYPESYRYRDDIDRWQRFMLDSIIEPVLTKDIQGSRKISKPALFKRTFELIMKYPAQAIALQKLLGQLQDRGNTTSIKHYLNLFEGAFLIKQLEKYSKNEIRKKASSPKIIPMSTSLCNAFDGFYEFSSADVRGRYFEAAIGAELVKERANLYYWSAGDFEVDFVVEMRHQTYAVEVKSGRSKKAVSLGQFLQKYPEAIPIVIDSDNCEDFFRLGLEGVINRQS